MACCINCYFGFSCVLEHKVLFKSVAVVHISIKMCNHPRENKRDSKKKETSFGTYCTTSRRHVSLQLVDNAFTLGMKGRLSIS